MNHIHRKELASYSTRIATWCVLGMVAVASGFYVVRYRPVPMTPNNADPIAYVSRDGIDTSGVMAVLGNIDSWTHTDLLEDHGIGYEQAVPRGLASFERSSGSELRPDEFFAKASLFHAKGDPRSAYKTLDEFEAQIKGTDLETEWLYSIIFYKGATALRMGENENCILCRGESSCIFPIASTAVHKSTEGSRLAIKHFTEYLTLFPDDLEVRWLLNLAHMTVGEHPAKVDPRYLLSMEACSKSEFDIGKFRDVGHLVGVNRLNQSGGAIMDDFDNDGLLDFAITCWAPSEPMAFYHNQGDGTVEDRTKMAGLQNQLGGLYCVQTDYNNDGLLDIFIPRGSWLPAHLAQRPSLLRSNPDGTFTDVTHDADLMTPTNSTSSTWADYDNDGLLDLFVCCQKQPCLLYRNKGDGAFEQVREIAGLPPMIGCQGAAWIDIDNDGYPELFTNNSTLGAVVMSKGKLRPVDPATALLFRNNRDGTFTDCTREMGIKGPIAGFSCWAFDYDNDGWLDIFATTTSHTLEEIVQGLLGQSCYQQSTAKLYRNLRGNGFQDVTQKAGLDKIYAPMGSNFGDLDNDGYLDFYLGTGAPSISTLVPNRLFKNVAGKRFSEVTASTRTGHLQKGHGVAFGDWDRNGTQDIFIELGGAIHGDRYHNVLYQNPGHDNNWLSIKLIGEKSNRAAIGARIKVVTTGENPLTVHRHVTSGSSFGANPLEQHIGLGKTSEVATLEIYWPTSGTTQVFHDIAVNQGLVITEFAKDFQKRSWKPIALRE